MAVVLVCLLCLGCLLPFCATDNMTLWFSNQLHVTVEEGRSQLVTIETSLPEYQQASATVHVVTLQEYESLTNDSQIEYKMALTELLRAHFNLTQVSFQYLDTAEAVDLSKRSYNISFNSGAATFGLEVTDDNLFENDEFFVMYVDIPKLQNETSRYASLVKILDNEDLSFTWNRPRINVYEDEGIIHKLLIIKHGNNEQNVTLHIQVDQTHQPFEAISGFDFLLLQTTFIFGAEVSNLSIPFEVYNDTVGEIPEHFYLNFTYQYGQNHIQPPDATVTVFIIDRIKFITQPENVSAVYGETAHFPCTSTSRVVPMWTIGNSDGTISFYPAHVHLPAYITQTPEGIDVTIQDFKLNLTNYTCSLEAFVPNPTTGLPSAISLHSHTGILTITFPPVSFYLLSQHGQGNHSAHVREGETIFFQVIKEGGGNHTYNVTTNITDSLLTDDLFFVFDPNTNEQDATIEIPNNLNLEDTLQFKIIIAEVNAIGFGRIDVDTGEPINVILYDNKYIIEFTPKITLSEQSADEDICANITKPSLVDPQVTIPLSLTSFNECLILEVNKAILSSANQAVCFNVHFIKNYTSCCKNFTIQPKWTLLKGNYSVTLQPQSIDIIIDCHETQGGSTKEIIIITSLLITSFVVCTCIIAAYNIVVVYIHKTSRRFKKQMWVNPSKLHLK